MKEKKDISPKVEKTLIFIKKFIAKHEYPPSVREVCQGTEIHSTATAFSHIKILEEKGYIKKTSNKFRTIELLVDNEYIKKDASIIKVPLLGKITAGSPITAIETPNEFFDLPASLLPTSGEVFTLHVSGESMINRGIYNNDYVIVKRSSTAKNGDIVVAMTSDDEVTLKTFYKEKDHIRLKPENDKMDDLIFDNITILGIAIGLYRKI